MHIIDRCLNPRVASVSRRFLRRAKAQLRQAVREVSQGRDIRDVMEGGAVAIPIDGMDESRFHRGPGGTRDHVLPGNREFIEGDVLPRPEAGGGKPKEAGEGDGKDLFRFVLTREEFLDLFLDDLEALRTSPSAPDGDCRGAPATGRLLHLRLAGKFSVNRHDAARDDAPRRPPRPRSETIEEA